MKEAGRNDVPTQPSNESPKVQPSVLAPFPPPAGHMVPQPSKGEWVDAPTTPLPQGPAHPMKGKAGKHGLVIKTSNRSRTLLGKKPKKAGAKGSRRKR